MKHGCVVVVVISEVLRLLCTKFHITISSLGVMTVSSVKNIAHVKQLKHAVDKHQVFSRNHQALILLVDFSLLHNSIVLSPIQLPRIRLQAYEKKN
jgi:hypothetical protein